MGFLYGTRDRVRRGQVCNVQYALCLYQVSDTFRQVIGSSSPIDSNDPLPAYSSKLLVGSPLVHVSHLNSSFINFNIKIIYEKNNFIEQKYLYWYKSGQKKLPQMES